MEPRKLVSLKFGKEQLERIDRWCKRTQHKRGKFIVLCGWKQAKRVLHGKPPLCWSLETEAKRSAEKDFQTIVVSLPPIFKANILDACRLLNHRPSLFLVWSVLAELDNVNAQPKK